MTVFGLDPGCDRSAIVVWDGTKILDMGLLSNDEMLAHLIYEREALFASTPILVLEAIQSYGMAVGMEVFRTVFWSGRFAQVWSPRRFEQMPRRQVKQHLCHSVRATDANIRQALIDRFGPTKEQAIGVKKTPGPLYGVKGDEWAALAVAVTFWDQHQTDIRPGVAAEF